MRDVKILFTGKVDENGVLKLAKRKDFDNELKQFAGKEIEGYVWRKKKRRSLDQNRYLFGVVYPAIIAGMKDLGHEDLTKEDIHEWAKAKFHDEDDAQIEVISKETGEVMTMRRTTTKFTTTRMMGYIASLQKFGAEFLGIYIPDPDPLFSADEQE